VSKITKSAQGEDCQIRLEGICNGNPETTVFCHLPGGGIGRKQKDLFGAYGCSSCHDEVDGRGSHSAIMYREEFYSAVFRTQDILLSKGLINA